MNFAYTTIIDKDFDSAVEAVQTQISEAGFAVLYVHDIQEKLTAKGFEREPFKIIEFCNAKYASEFLGKDINIGLCLPCKINVYINNDATYISGMRPLILKGFFPEVDLGDKPEEVDSIIQAIIDKAK